MLASLLPSSFRRGLAATVLGLCLSQGCAVGAEILVIANRDGPVTSLSQQEIVNCYMGRKIHLKTGEEIVAYEHERQSPLREQYFRALTGKSISQINAYWARLQFSGDVLPPVALPDNQAILKAVQSNRRAIAYIDASAADNSVRVLLRLKSE